MILFSLSAECFLVNFFHDEMETVIRPEAPPLLVCIPLAQGEDERLMATCKKALRNAVSNPQFLIFTESPSVAASRLAERYDSVRIVKTDIATGHFRVRAGLKPAPTPHEIIRAIPKALSRHDIMIARPGVWLPKAWDGRLAFAAYADDKIATVSPMREAHPFFSLLPEGRESIDEDEAGNMALAFGSRLNYEIPSFLDECVYIRRDALNAISKGGFETRPYNPAQNENPAWLLSETFRRRGLSNVICDHVFVGGTHPKSTPRAWPTGSIPTGPTHPLARLRIAVKEAVTTGFTAPQADLRPCQLHIAHSWGGGLEKWVTEYARADGYRKNLILKSNGMIGEYGQKLELYENPDDEKPARMWMLPYPIRATAITNLDYKRVLDTIIKDYGVSAILASSFIGHSLDILRTGLPTIHVMHDYYPFCPALNVYFDGLCSSCGPDKLARCFAQNNLNAHFKNVTPEECSDIRKWYLDLVLSEKILLAAPSESVAKNLKNLAPRLDKRRFRIIPHGSDFSVPERIVPREGGKLRIVILGRMAPQKGLGILEKMVDGLAEMADLYLVGCGAGGKPFEGRQGVTVIPEYEHDALPEIMRGISPHLALLMSTVPETFSYTLSELFALGVPVLASRAGSFADRIRNEATGFLCAPNPPSFTGKIKFLSAHPEKLAEIRKNLRSIRSQSVRGMVALYHVLLPLPFFIEKRYALPVRLPLKGEKIKDAAEKKMAAQTATVDTRIFKWNWKAGVNELGFTPRRILLFRSARDWLLELAIGAISESWKCDITFLCQREHAGRFPEKFPSIAVIAVNGPGFLSLQTMGTEELEKLRGWRPDTAIIITAGAVYDGYENVVEIAKASGAGRIFFVNAAGAFRKA
jgi:glycosyltransferase involved in cell wall biosynthesis